QEALAALAGYPFPGNIRELENVIRRALAISPSGFVTVDCLPPEITVDAGRIRDQNPEGESSLIADRPCMDELQRRYLQLILEECRGNRRRAASILKLDRRTVQRLLARYRLSGSTEPDDDLESESE